VFKSLPHRPTGDDDGIGRRLAVVAVSVNQRVDSDHQLARLLQIGIVLEEVVEARAYRHYQSLAEEDRDLEPDVEALLEHAAEESARHREQLEELVAGLDADSVPFEDIETLVEARYGRTKPEDFDGVLYDQLCNEETAYKFYDDLIEAVEESDAEFSVDREELLAQLRSLREEEAEGVEEVTRIMEARS
jgi:rubrerythrin